jgi:hypothetical protein
MSWVRIEENALTHRKIIGLTDGAFRLWVAGLAHCQQHLTDGLILRLVLCTLVGMTRKRVDELVTAGLWVADPEGFRVNDYLGHNESREVVLQKRLAAKERMRGRRSHEVPAKFARTHSERSGEVLQKFACGVSLSSSALKLTEEGAGETKSLTERAGEFCEWYAEEHSTVIGVGYIGNPQNDYRRSQELCQVFGDQELRDAAVIWFGQKDDFAMNGTRTITKFASRASDLVKRARKVTA